MACGCCCSRKSCIRLKRIDQNASNSERRKKLNQPFEVTKKNIVNDDEEGAMSSNSVPNERPEHLAAQTFLLRELAAATKNFRSDCLLGKGGFGRVYRGRLESINQVVAIKQLDLHGYQGNREFLVEVLILSLLHHPNLVSLIGFCADGDQRLLVYEYMPLGSLADHLFDYKRKKKLDWSTRMKIAAGAAKGLEYLHDKANPPVIYRDLKCSNILLGEGYHPKLSDFGYAKLGPEGDNSHVSTRVMGTQGYCAPEYAMTGQLTTKSDIYSFGVVLLEIITGRRAVATSRGNRKENLVVWARPLFRDRKKFVQMADPMLRGQYPIKGLYQAIAVAAMCVQEEPAMRPPIADVVAALSFLAAQSITQVHTARIPNWNPNPNPNSTQNIPRASTPPLPNPDPISTPLDTNHQLSTHPSSSKPESESETDFYSLPSLRPPIADVVTALSFLTTQSITQVHTAPIPNWNPNPNLNSTQNIPRARTPLPKPDPISTPRDTNHQLSTHHSSSKPESESETDFYSLPSLEGTTKPS